MPKKIASKKATPFETISPDQVPAATLEAMLAVATSVNVDDIVEQLITGAKTLPDVSGASVWWSDAAGRQLTPVAGSPGVSGRTIPIRPGSAVEKAYLADIPTELSRPGQLGTRLKAKHLLASPITDRYQRFGLLLLTSTTGFGTATRFTTGHLARQAASSLVNSARLRQLLDSNAAGQLQTQKLHNLYHVLERFSGIRSEETLLKLVPKLACSALGYSYAVIESLQGSQLSFIHAASQSPGNRKFLDVIKQSPKRRLGPGSLIADAIEQRQPVPVDDPQHDPRVRRKFLKQYCANLVAVPLLDDDGSVSSVLLVGHHRARGHRTAPIQTSDLELLNVFSKLVVYALSSIRYSVYRRRGIDIARIPARTVEEFTAEVVKKLPGVAAASQAVIALPDESGKLVPAATTDSGLLTKRYRKWLADLPFSRYDFPASGFPAVPALKIREGDSLTVPILYENENLGMVHILDKISGNFTEKDLGLMRLMTTRIGYVLKNLEFVHRLSREKQQFSSIVHNTADGIISLNSDLKVEFFNQAMEEITGYRASEVLGISVQDLFDPRTEDDRPFDFSQLQLQGRDTLARTASIVTQSGDRKWVGITATPQVTVERSQLMILVIRDITQEHNLRERQREFVSIASHEMRTPITALIGYLSLVQSAQTEDEEQREHFIGRAYAAATRLSELIEDLLSVTRIEEGRVALNLRPVNPGEVAAEVVQNLQAAARGKKQQIKLVDRLGKHDVAELDRSKLHQIIANLVDNAIKYTQDGGKITVTCSGSAKNLTVSVKDNGIGIHPDNLQRIFDKFFREYTELSVTAGGTGLGLFITKELVEQQGGTLDIVSNHGQGTTAKLKFPRPARKKRRN